ncbi:hypothetical protein ASAP_2846 [Asaia bogorensis]|uniref:Uncharacterized protein n=1 Tax=Asaia bogorensis TaxID=91915 RepID=A0A060QLM6_9PROT|nr:hypothetical protein ASAP_2846 [Asaia bogorensis]
MRGRQEAIVFSYRDRYIEYRFLQILFAGYCFDLESDPADI